MNVPSLKQYGASLKTTAKAAPIPAISGLGFGFASMLIFDKLAQSSHSTWADSPLKQAGWLAGLGVLGGALAASLGKKDIAMAIVGGAAALMGVQAYDYYKSMGAASGAQFAPPFAPQTVAGLGAAELSAYPPIGPNVVPLGGTRLRQLAGTRVNPLAANDKRVMREVSQRMLGSVIG